MTTVRISNYKSIGNEYVGFDDLNKINIVVGKNNIGKSSVLDMIELSTNLELSDIDFRKLRDDQTSLFFSETIDPNDYESALNININLNGNIVGAFPIACKFFRKNGRLFSWIYSSDKEFYQFTFPDELDGIGKILANTIRSPFWHYKCVRLNAERDITPEDLDPSVGFDENGRGITNTIRAFLTQHDKNQTIVEKNLLSFINKSLHPDNFFSRIQVKMDQNSRKWEIYLYDQGKPVALSSMGTGIKTILSVGTIFEVGLSSQLWGSNMKIILLEEIENNLHPAAQRQLCSVILDRVIESNSIVFITTHSSSIIDFFSEVKEANIYHFYNQESKPTIQSSITNDDRRRLLDDLQVRASDLLQANVILWVEGPSDRTFIARWIELATDGRFVEGVHYKCVLYGGRLLSHYTADDDEELINVLQINKKCIIVVDSDKRSEFATINNTKKRIRKEINDHGGHFWITKGREIENYIDKNTSERFFKSKCITNPGIFDDYYDWAKTEFGKSAEKHKNKKAAFANKISENMDKSILDNLDLGRQISQIVRFIGRANDMSIS